MSLSDSPTLPASPTPPGQLDALVADVDTGARDHRAAVALPVAAEVASEIRRRRFLCAHDPIVPAARHQPDTPPALLFDETGMVEAEAPASMGANSGVLPLSVGCRRARGQWLVGCLLVSGSMVGFDSPCSITSQSS